MPDSLSVIAVEPEVEGIDLGDSDHTYDTLLEQVAAHASDWDEPVGPLVKA